MTYSKFITATGLLVALVATGMSLSAQDADQTPARGYRGQSATTRSQTRFESPALISPATAYGIAASPRWQPVETSPMSKAVLAFKKAESDTEKSDAKSEIRKELVKEYDQRMDQYDAQIELLEKELEEMRSRLSRRRAAKDEMVDLRLQEVVAEANGLGWPSESKSRGGLFFPSRRPTPSIRPTASFPGNPLSSKRGDAAKQQ